MERTYIRGNKKHWKEVYEWAWGKKPDEDYDGEESCYASDTCIILKQGGDAPFPIYEEEGGYYTYKALYDAITTNPSWHEVKPWENNWKPKPFDKVLGWDYNENSVMPDVFLYKAFDTYSCARCCFKHVKPYDEEEYLKSLENSTDNE